MEPNKGRWLKAPHFQPASAAEFTLPLFSLRLLSFQAFPNPFARIKTTMGGHNSKAREVC